jgi:K+-transporting ATPase ATPase C chain
MRARKHLAPAVRVFVLLSLAAGVLYPLAVHATTALLFPHQASGSLVERDGRVVGSSLIGQHFHSAGYFWGRPSATGSRPYEAMASGGSNLGPANPAQREAVAARIAALRAADPGNETPVPIDLVTASASGLDPEISPAAARYQASRVARARGLEERQVLALIAAHERPRRLGFWGEPRVDVLRLNLALDASRQ